MNRSYDLIVSRSMQRHLLTLEDIAARCRVHPTVVERLTTLGVIDPEAGEFPQFRPEMVLRLQRGLPATGFGAQLSCYGPCVGFA
jgi:hypothetical protein